MLPTPVRQTATATIDTLGGRLQSATLLEDRRAAILGLRSFAKQYPASVASGSLRELIATLKRDGVGEHNGDGGRQIEDGAGDVDTIRLVLETLLMLFHPDSGSPEAGDEIAFFLADEFAMRQENAALLLNLLDPTGPFADYYSRLYSVQILSAICAARPEKLRECVLAAPLGISRLVGILDDGRDAVRNAGLLLLLDLTSGANEELRKIVAFEDVFGKAFALIRLEGGLAEAGITAQDCLSLLANLVKGSSSNQTMFRESGCVAQMAHLVQEAFPPEASEAAYVSQSREKSAFGLLQLLRLFWVPGESSTPQNQTAFCRANMAQTLIDLSFSIRLPTRIRTLALKCASELIGNNPPLQEQFAALTVVTPVDSQPVAPPVPQVNGTRSTTPSTSKPDAHATSERPRTYIIEALLELALEQPQSENILRIGACRLIQAYLAKHDRIRAHFLGRAIAGHAEQEQVANVLTVLSQPSGDASALMFASWIVQDLIADNIDGKAALASVKEGNENEGEDVLSFIQTLGSHLEEAQLQSADERVIASYSSLLTVFLWEFAHGVDDLLAESSSLLQALSRTSKSGSLDTVIEGLSCTLLGTVYEFSTKDSPIPRRTLAPLLIQKLGRSNYLDALMQLRREPAVRDFDILEDEDGEALLSNVFVELFSVEYSRLRKAIDKDPGLEVLPPSAAEAGVDRDVLDDLRQQLQTVKDALAMAQDQALDANQKQEQERLSATKDLQTVNAEVDRLRRINQAMQTGQESELEKVAKQHQQQMQDIHVQHQQALLHVQMDSQHQVRTAVQQSEASFTEKVKDFERRIAELGNTHRAERSEHASTRQQLEELSAKHTDLSTREGNLAKQHDDLLQRNNRLDKEHQQLQASASQSNTELDLVREDLERHHSELTTLQSQVAELRDELKAREAELITERAGFSELEKELEAAKREAQIARSALETARSAATSAATPDGADTAPHGTEMGSATVAQLEATLNEAREAEKSAKEELESMLLVMSDIEAKRDVYRARIKEMGGEVSDDDEDDDEEEDEDGEEVDEDDVD